ncbi:hypothetical protein BDB00DRAFT_152365 [Zychaea mexicana]|uniref:uncharacterized protein n=1 Tax=Zychaea mexicana TaxID=64656 RepID=UPI0022FECB86|nr:uncharacterized protein BDB00DRAFT_152365 [Zychaea mexicana]KAI9484365.1 hypothetical protein BDB00DRAFT_152365 [Zychaea mexicana]
MGALFSKQKTDPNDYEKILSELDESIQKAEVRLSEIKIRERRTGLLWIIYGTIAWAAFLLYSFIVLHGEGDEHEWNTLAVTLLPVLVIPLGIYYTRRLLKWFYTRKQTNEEANLAALRAQQKLKVEELKKKTSYYTTKSLLERYDLAAAQRRKQEQQAQQRAMATGATPRQQQPGAQQQQLRQRSGGPGPSPQGQGMVQPQQGGGPAAAAAATAGTRGLAPVHLQARTPVPQQPKERQWYDKLVDALVGEEGPETKYALICRHCFTHNGLVLPQEIDLIQYTCPNCKQFNPARKLANVPASPTPPPPQQQSSPSPSSSTNEIHKEQHLSPITGENGSNHNHHHEQHPSPRPEPELEPYKVSDEEDEAEDGDNKKSVPNTTNAEGIKAS